ncbi:MAG: anhydro-N-acetylmuramic acid kinase [Planctomycetota bacterium]
MVDEGADARRVVGCMTGTSLDGIDVALGVVRGRGLQGMSVEYGGMVSLDMSGGLREGLLRVAEGGAVTGLEVLRLRRQLGELHAEAVGDLVEQVGGEIDLVVAHGQTVWHVPGDEAGALSWQLFDPWPVVRRLGVPVGYDLRQADLIAGGQGAPITPVSDCVMYRGVADWVVNLGGVMNATRLAKQPERVKGMDLYPCNLMLDGLCQRLFGERFDAGGEYASRGRMVEGVVGEIGERFERFSSDRTLGREQIGEAWLDELTEAVRGMGSPEDVLHSAAWLIGSVVEVTTCKALRRPRTVLAGGGTRNRTLVRLIEEANGGEVLLSDDVGIPAAGREAIGMAVLGALSWDGVPVTLPGVTGADEPGLAGAWVYPAGYERER